MSILLDNNHDNQDNNLLPYSPIIPLISHSYLPTNLSIPCKTTKILIDFITP